MKKKIFAFLLVLASVIACVVCASACSEKGSHPAEYVGKYEGISTRSILIYDGEQTIEEFEDDSLLELKDDGNYVLTFDVEGASASISGTWSVDGGKLSMASKDGSGSYSNVTLVDDILTISTRMEANDGGILVVMINETKFKKVVEEIPAE